MTPIETLCARLEMTQTALAAASGVSQAALSLCHQGVNPLPKKLVRYLEETGFDTSGLLREQERFQARVLSRLRARAKEQAAHDPHLP